MTGPDAIFDTTTPANQGVRRITAVEADDMAHWILPQIVALYGVTPLVARGWMRVWVNDNAFSFVRTDNAAGLALRTFAPIGGAVRVEEAFVILKPGVEGAEAEGVDIYRNWLNWAKSGGIHEFRFNTRKAGDVEGLKKHFPKMKYFTTVYLEV